MLRKLVLVAFTMYAAFELTACCCPLSACGPLCSALGSIPTGILLVQTPAQNDSALVSSDTAVIAEQPTCNADNPMPF